MCILENRMLVFFKTFMLWRKCRRHTTFKTWLCKERRNRMGSSLFLAAL